MKALRSLQRVLVSVVLVAAVVAAALGSPRPAAKAAPVALSSLCGSLGSPPATYSHVIWIWMENHSYEKIVGPPGSKQAKHSPFVNGTLIPDCGLATNYHSVSHPSLPNYVAATSGWTQGLTSSCRPSSCALSAVSLFEQASTWRSYQESMPSNCYPTDSGAYPVDHNPAAYYTRVASECAAWDVPMGTTSSGRLASDLAGDTLPQFAFLVPDECNSTETCSISTGDSWLKGWITKIALSKAYQSGKTAVFVTWDEGSGGTAGEDCLSNLKDTSCHVAAIAITPYTRPGTTSSTLFTHYSLLKTTEQLLGLPLLGHAGDKSTQSLRTSFGF